MTSMDKDHNEGMLQLHGKEQHEIYSFMSNVWPSVKLNLILSCCLALFAKELLHVHAKSSNYWSSNKWQHLLTMFTPNIKGRYDW